MSGSTGSAVTAPGYQASANLQQLLFDFNHARDLLRQSTSFSRIAGLQPPKCGYASSSLQTD